jgi:hypothetical protein
VFVLRAAPRFLFPDTGDAGETRAALKRRFERGQLRRRANGEHFHAAVQEISDVAADFQLFRDALHKEAEADTLHHSGDKVTPGLFLVAHELPNCSREREIRRVTPAIGRSASIAVAERNCAKIECIGKGCFPRMRRILFCMKTDANKLVRSSLARLTAILAICACGAGLPLCQGQSAQQGPLTPPPEHDVKRIGIEPVPPAPPSLPPEEIIKRFSQKEDEYLMARAGYTYKKTVRLEEFAPDGKPAGQLLLSIEGKPGADGKIYEKTVERPQSTLQLLQMSPEDFQKLARMPAYALTTSQLAKYDLKYLGKELVDEVDCYIFQVKPKSVERSKAYFDGIVWVDAQYLELVKSYGKWVTDLGDMRSPTMPFAIFETYRENVDGKYWFPNYMRSDDTLNLKDMNVPVRIVIKWTDYKPVSAASTAAPQQPAAAEKPPS